MEKRLELSVETLMKCLKTVYHLKCVGSGYEIVRSYEKCNAVQTRFTSNIFLD